MYYILIVSHLCKHHLIQIFFQGVDLFAFSFPLGKRKHMFAQEILEFADNVRMVWPLQPDISNFLVIKLLQFPLSKQFLVIYLQKLPVLHLFIASIDVSLVMNHVFSPRSLEFLLLALVLEYLI